MVERTTKKTPRKSFGANWLHIKGKDCPLSAKMRDLRMLGQRRERGLQFVALDLILYQHIVFVKDRQCRQRRTAS